MQVQTLRHFVERLASLQATLECRRNLASSLCCPFGPVVQIMFVGHLPLVAWLLEVGHVPLLEEGSALQIAEQP